MEELERGGSGLPVKLLRDAKAETERERYELEKLRMELDKFRDLPHTDGLPRIYRLVRDHMEGFPESLKGLGVDFTFDEMLEAGNAAKFVAFTEAGQYKPRVLCEDYFDCVQNCAAYREYADFFADKSRNDVVRVLSRTLELAERYGVAEAEIARCAVSLSKYMGEGDAEYYLNAGHALTIRNVLKRRHVRGLPPRIALPYEGGREERPLDPEPYKPLLEGTLRFFAENLNEDMLLPGVIDLRAKNKLDFTTPLDMAAVGFYLVCAADFGALDERGFRDKCARLIASFEAAEKWKGHPCNFISLADKKAVKLKYAASYDAAVFQIALKLLHHVAVGYGDNLLSDRIARLYADLKLFLDPTRDRFWFGYFPAQKRFDAGHYEQMYGNGLLLHLATDTELDSMIPLTTDPYAGLIVNLFYPVAKYLKVRAPGERDAFWKLFLYAIHTGRPRLVERRLYACCNWGMSESGSLDDLTYRPFHAALILLALSRDNVREKLEKPLVFGFEKPAYYRAQAAALVPAPAFSPGDDAKQTELSAACGRLTLSGKRVLRCFTSGREALFPRLFCGGREITGFSRFRFLEDCAEYLWEGESGRVLLRYRCGEAFSLEVRLTGEAAAIDALIPEGCAAVFNTEGGDLTPQTLPVNSDFALRAAGRNADGYDRVYRLTEREFTLTWRGGRARGERDRNSQLEALLDEWRIPAPSLESPGKRAQIKCDLAGNYLLEFDCYAFEDFTYTLPSGKYLAGFTGLGFGDLDVVLLDAESREAFSPYYWPLLLAADYSVLLTARGARYTAAYSGLTIALELACGGDFSVNLTITNCQAKRRKLSLALLPREGLAKFAAAERLELVLPKYGKAELARTYSTGLGLSYEPCAGLRLAGCKKSAENFFNRMLMPSVANLPRFADWGGERLGDAQLAAFSKLLMFFDPAYSRKLLLRLFARQNLDGVLSRREVTFFLPYLTGEYIACTGDEGILDVELTYTDCAVQDAVRYHLLKCLELAPANPAEQLLCVFLYDSFLNFPAFPVNRYAMVKRRDAARRELPREAEGGPLYEICVLGDLSKLYRRLSQRFSGKVVCYGKGEAEDVALAVYTDILVTRVFGLLRRGDALSFRPELPEELEHSVLKCELAGSRLTVSYGGDGEGVVVDGVAVDGDTRIKLPGKKKALKIRVNL